MQEKIDLTHYLSHLPEKIISELSTEDKSMIKRKIRYIKQNWQKKAMLAQKENKKLTLYEQKRIISNWTDDALFDESLSPVLYATLLSVVGHAMLELIGSPELDKQQRVTLAIRDLPQSNVVLHHGVTTFAYTLDDIKEIAAKYSISANDIREGLKNRPN